jgi:AcrR family transcriptional regulator
MLHRLPDRCPFVEGIVMREDGERNRERIVDAARVALDGHQPPTMAAVARAAGVGQATLYRNFATWSELVLAVHRTDMNELVESAPRLLKAHRPIEALKLWLEQLAVYGRIKKGLSEALHAQLGTDNSPVTHPLELFISAGKSDGSIRPDVDAEDVFLLVSFLWRLELTPHRDQRAERLISVILDGLRVT